MLREPRIKQVAGALHYRCCMCKAHKPEDAYHPVVKYRHTGEMYTIPFSRCKTCQIVYQRERRARLAQLSVAG